MKTLPDFKPPIRSMLAELISFRHDLHANPERAYEERRTSSKVLEVLQALPNLRIETGLAGGTGIIATLNHDSDGPCVLLRGDMDALPIQEGNDLPYKSKRDGVMHACGHDGHTTCLLGAARVLSHYAGDLPGAVKFCFQPAEEEGGGGQRMIDDGALEDPQVDAAFALHGWPDLEVGRILTTAGPMLAASSAFEIDFVGRGGHAAYPHRNSDLIAASAQFVANAQAIRTRFIDPIQPVVISFTSIVAGETHNVLPEKCHVKGTIRALNDKAHMAARNLLQKFLQSTVSSFEIQADVRFLDDYPVLINDPACALLVNNVARELLGGEQIHTHHPAGLGGEDFAFFARRVPSAMYRLGLRPPGTFDYPSLHNPRFNFNDESVPIGVHMHCAVAFRYLTQGGETADQGAMI